MRGSLLYIHSQICTIFALVLIIVSSSLPRSTSASQSSEKLGEFGAGIILGNPSGLSGKLWLERKQAIDFGLAFSLSSYFQVFSDYLLHFPNAFGKRGEFVSRLSPYIGIGGTLAISTGSDQNSRPFSDRKDFTGLGVRIPLGIEWIPQTPSIGVFIELVPGLFIIPGTEGFLNWGMGARYYF